MKFKIRLFLSSVVAALVLAVVAVPVAPAYAGNSFFSFDNYAVGTPAESVFQPGVTFSTSHGGDAWQVGLGSPYRMMARNVLQASHCDATLFVRLDTIHTDFSFRFGITESTEVLVVDAWLGAPGVGTRVSNQYLTGAWIGAPDNIREGVASATTSGYDHLVIYSPGGCTAIDDLSLTGALVYHLPGEVIGIPLPVPQIPWPVDRPLFDRAPVFNTPILDVPVIVNRLP